MTMVGLTGREGVVAPPADLARLPPAVSRLVAWVPLVGAAVLLAVFVTARPAYYTVLDEDHLVEWVQFALCAFAALVAAAATYRLMTGGRSRTAAAATALFAVGMVLLAGEEVSWGQRVFAFTTPPELAAVNQQAEFNVHNVGSGAVADLFKAISFALGAVGAVWIFASRRWSPGPSSPLRVLQPPRAALSGFLAIALYRPVIFAAPMGVVNPLSRLQEWAEVCLFLSLTATIVVVHLRARHDGQPASRSLPYLAVGVCVVTVVFAALTAHHGIVPGNLQPSGA